MRSRERYTPEPTFLDAAVVRAADRAAEEVLNEDRLLRTFGIAPRRGRSR